MSKITELLNQVYKPMCAIIAYEAEGKYSNTSTYYLEQHKINKDGSLGAGKPLLQRTIVNIFNAVSQSNKQLDSSLYGVVPENVLYCDTRIGNEKIVWYRKPEDRILFFSEGLGIENGKMGVPGLIYCVKGKNLSVYAFKGSKPKNMLYRAPFMNTSESGVCLGNSKVTFPEERTFENVMKYWEIMFWQSEFSHILGDNPCLGNLATITKECIASGSAFPQDMLKPSKLKLQDLLK